MENKLTRKQMVDFITNVAMDCGQVKLASRCGKYFNLMYNSDNTIVVESFEPNDNYGFTNINDLSDEVVEKIYTDVYEDFGDGGDTDLVTETVKRLLKLYRNDSEVCMAEFLASEFPKNLSFAEAFEVYVTCMQIVEGDKFYWGDKEKGELTEIQ